MISRRTLVQAGGGLAAAAIAGLTARPAFGATRGATTALDWSPLRSALRGDLVLPSDSGYGTAVQLHWAEYDSVHPQALAYCETAGDVKTCIKFAQDHGVAVRTRSGGHNFAGWSTGEGLVLDVSRIGHVTVGSGTVHVGPGVQSVDALAALQPYGRQLITGTCATVRAGGFVHGGGIGLQTRTFGLASDHLVSATVVLADGRAVRACADEHADLYWALRGSGGGNFGVVVDYELSPIAAPTGVFFSTVWSWDRVQDVLGAWQQWILNGSRLLNSTALVVLPDAGAGAVPVVQLMGAYWGPQTELDAALDALTSAAGTTPFVRQAAELPYDQVMSQVYGCGQLTTSQCHRVGDGDGQLPRTAYQRERHRIFNAAVPGTGLDQILAGYDSDRRSGQTRVLYVNTIGGAAGDTGRCSTAYWHRDAQFIVGIGALPNTATFTSDDTASIGAWVNNGFNVIDPLSTGRSYINFPDEALTGWREDYYGGNYARLLTVKSTYDRHNFFNHPRSIGS
jgi:FAD binding domain/Berberine and berberine like